MPDLLARLLAECDAHVTEAVHDDAASGREGEQYLTFNRVNVRLELDRGVTTMKDELDPAVEQALPIAELVAELSLAG